MLGCLCLKELVNVLDDSSEDENNRDQVGVDMDKNSGNGNEYVDNKGLDSYQGYQMRPYVIIEIDSETNGSVTQTAV